MDLDDLGNAGHNPEDINQAPSEINISEIIDAVLQGDPSAKPIFEENLQQQQLQHQYQHQQQPEAVRISPNPVHQSHPSVFKNKMTLPPNASLEIVVQPQAKGLRFRYECEGRSAGSIPGVGSTPENKTFPTLRVNNYKGPITIVVSLVTKDQPYRPHPHNLVGKGCSKGVYTLKLNNDSMIATFGNLGIQCVKKKEIEGALKVRHDLRIDPFRTRYDHRHQPSTIDLNCARLCFQAFIPTETIENNVRKTIHVPIDPIVSDPIYDKKAMSDLMICKLSKPSGSIEGNELMILLCEKVTKEDIQVRFFEGNQDAPTWEALAVFQSTDVHKQVAISFKTPPYCKEFLDDKANCFIQLKRPSDGALSEPVPFEYYNANRGRRSILALRKSLKAQNSLEVNLDENPLEISPILNGIHKDDEMETETEIINCNLIEPNIVTNMDIIDSTEKTSEWLEKTEFAMNTEPTVSETAAFSPQSNITFNCDTKPVSPVVSRFDGDKSVNAFSEMSNDDDQTLNELLEQVAELDEIYSGYQTKRDGKLTEIKALNGNESFDFDDTATYTSLQRAFKNPVAICDPEPTLFNENIQAADSFSPSLTPISDLSPLKRNDRTVEEEKLPPLPPKRLRKITAENTEYNANLLPIPNQTDGSQMSPIIIKRSPESRSPASSTTNSAQTSPQKKQGFFSRIFRRKSKSDINSNAGTETKNSPNLSRESSFTNFEGFDRNRLSTRSFKLPQSPTKKGKPVGRSVSSVSGKRPHLTADVVHIPLKGNGSEGLPMRSGSGNLLPEHYMSNVTLSNNLDRKTVSALQLADIPLHDGNMELVAIADAQSLKNLCEGQYGVHLDDDVDLSEAEHFALYTSAAPHATQSEFDEMSAFYAPIEAAEVVPNAEIAKRLALSGSPKNLR